MIPVTFTAELLEYARQQAEASPLLDRMPLPADLSPLDLYLNNLVLREVADEVKRREPNLHADCATHVCRNCGTEWGNHDGPPTA